MPLKAKLLEWLKRYGWAEVGSLVGAYTGFYLVKFLFDHTVSNAYAGSIGETIGYYLVIFWREYKQPSVPEANIFIKFFHLITEFGPAEILDTFFLRPLFMGLGIYFVGDFFGVLIGKITADITFYIPVIFSYELRKKIYRKKK